MFFKIAIKNIQKSFKDYSIYFLTLILSVCMFYCFNSIGSQKAIIELNNSLNAEYIDKLIDIMSGISVFVSIILSFLIVYANNFLIKNRKKELGLYMILGMGKRKISRILMTETFIVGIISLFVGLLLGIVISQGLSTLTLSLFDVGMDEYIFNISTSAIIKTILYFSIMFLLVMIFNIVLISKYKIIDLLKAHKKNENLKIRNPYIFLLLFIISIISFGFAYKNILTIGLDLADTTVKLSIASIVLCTILFFFSLSGFVLYIVSKNKKIYFKKLNIFILKQINNKVNTNFVSMSLICIMLTLTLIILSLGISFKNSFESDLSKATPFDASIILRANDKSNTIQDFLKKTDFHMSKDETYTTYTKYDSEIKLQDLFKIKDNSFDRFCVVFVKLSDYNNILKLKKEKEVNLNKDEVLIFSNYTKLIKPINENLKFTDNINLNGKQYSVKNKKAIETNLETYPMTNIYCEIVINDAFLSNYTPSESVLNVMYSSNSNRSELNKKYDELHSNLSNKNYSGVNINKLKAFSKDAIYARSKGGSATLLFIGIYLGIIFLITSMAILALQQLSDASDSIERYRSLRKIGANEKMIYKTIFIQTFIYFCLPLALALMHSTVGIIVTNDYINKFNQTDIKFSLLVTILIFFTIYTCYFYTTYLAYKNIIKNNI